MTKRKKSARRDARAGRDVREEIDEQDEPAEVMKAVSARTEPTPSPIDSGPSRPAVQTSKYTGLLFGAVIFGLLALAMLVSMLTD